MPLRRTGKGFQGTGKVEGSTGETAELRVSAIKAARQFRLSPIIVLSALRDFCQSAPMRFDSNQDPTGNGLTAQTHKPDTRGTTEGE